MKRIRDWTIDDNNTLVGVLEDGRPIQVQVTDRWMINRARPFIRTPMGDVYELVLDGKMTTRGTHCTG